MLVTIIVITTFPPEWLQSLAEIVVGKPPCLLQLSVSLFYYNYSNLKERVICEALAPFLPEMVQILCFAANTDDEQGFDWVPTVNDVLQQISKNCSKCFSEPIFRPEGL